MGDDTTDEDMFKALEGEAYTIKVNNGASSAQYTILSQQQVLPLLNSLLLPPAAAMTPPVQSPPALSPEALH
jgi:trehalose 6-phosphate synthase/phosphatase